MTAEDVGSGASAADIAGGKQQDAACAHRGSADRMLGLTHGPDQTGGPLGREQLCDALELLARHAGNALDLLRRPLLDLLADLVHAVDALGDEFLVLPAVLEDVPQHAPDDRNVRAVAQPHVFRRVCSGAGEPRIGNNEVGSVELLALEDVLQRHRMRLGGVAAQEEDRLGVADVVVAVGHRAVAPGIGHARDGRRVTDARLVVGVVRAPERGKLAIEISGFVGELRRAQPIDGVGARLFADLQ